jgi:transcription termination factor NusB
MTVSVARKIAFEILRRVEAEGAYASDLLHAELSAEVRAEDAGLATELVLGVLRWRRLLDFLLEHALKKPVARLDLPVALALRMGLYQLRFLERVPARAAVNESVELVKRAKLQPLLRSFCQRILQGRSGWGLCTRILLGWSSGGSSDLGRSAPLDCSRLITGHQD